MDHKSRVQHDKQFIYQAEAGILEATIWALPDK